MRFRTEYKGEPAPWKLDPRSPVVMAGSCFSQNIAEKMESHGWEAVNPLGTLYNPHSIAEAIKLMTDEEKGAERFEKSLFQHNGIWNSEYFDSSFSAIERDDCIKEFRLRSKEFKEKLTEGRTLIVTFGTSICYHKAERDMIVGNCHKLPANRFFRCRLSVERVRTIWGDLIGHLGKEYPGLRIIFTVSPVRHLKDGFVANSRSKAVLQLAIEEICIDNDKAYYFPAYEILNDDLRDYRFYAGDLAHPSEEAVDYIWEKFLETYIDEEGMRILMEGLKKRKASGHRPKKGALGKILSR